MKLFQVVSTGLKLDTLLINTLNSVRHLLKSQSQTVLTESHVYLREKKIVRHQVQVKKGTVVSILVPNKYMAKPPFELIDSQIVYEDNEIIVVDKPSGLPTQATQQPGEDHLFSAVIAFLTQRNPSKLAYVGLHHRLDRDTSGLVLMTKKSSANKSISDQFKDRTIHKKYLAVVEGDEPEQKRWKVDAAIRRVYGSKEFRFGVDLKKGDPAVTLFEYKKNLGGRRHLIECEPITGRTHQIRIHLAHSRLPILGDRVYGVKSDARMQLHAYRLQIKHPRTGEPLDLRSSFHLDF